VQTVAERVWVCEFLLEVHSWLSSKKILANRGGAWCLSCAGAAEVSLLFFSEVEFFEKMIVFIWPNTSFGYR